MGEFDEISYSKASKNTTQLVEMSQKMTELQNTGVDTTARASMMDYLNLGKTEEGGTSANDNYTLLSALIATAKTNENGLYIPNGRYYCSENLVIDGIRNIRVDGEIVMAPDKILELTYHSDSSFGVDWHVNEVVGKLRISGVKNARVTVQEATELELYANGDITSKSSIAYSQFFLGTITTLRIFSEGAVDGWINENAFFGGRIANLIMDGNYEHNNNTFYKPMLEACDMQIINGSSNSFFDCRFEGSCTISLSAKTHNNIFTQQHAVQANSVIQPVSPTVTDLGAGNSIMRSQMLFRDKRDIFLLNKNTKIFNGSSENGALGITAGLDKLKVSSWEDVYISDFIPVTPGFGFEFYSDATIWRPHIYIFDANKQAITGETDPDAISASGITWSATGNYYYGVNVDSLEPAMIKSSTVKYIKLRLLSGNTTSFFKYANMVIYERKTTDRLLINYTTDRVTYPIVSETSPTSGFAKLGQLVSKTTGGIWTCIKSLDYTVQATAVQGATLITSSSAIDLANGDIVGILLDDGTTHWTAVSDLSGATFTIAALPSQASEGNRLVVNLWA